MGFTNAEANALNTFLDYYLDEPEAGCSVPTEDKALEALALLTGKAHKTLSAGWREQDVVKHWRPRTTIAPEPNEEDVEDCPTCEEAKDMCQAHRLIAGGEDRVMRGVRDILQVFVKDPEVLSGVLTEQYRQCTRDQGCKSILHLSSCLHSARES